VADEARLECDPRAQDLHVHFRAVRSAYSVRDKCRQLGGRPLDWIGWIRPPGLVGEPLFNGFRLFPKHAVASLIGLGSATGSTGGIIFPILCGFLLDKFTAAGNVTGGYAVLFVICAFAYLVAFALNHLCAPRFDELSAPELQK
jgi:nitrate/nitrite transporter NarK